MTRILIVTQTAHTMGGVETWLDDLAPALARQHDVTLGLVRGRHFHDPDEYRRVRTPRVPSIEIDGRTGTREGRVSAIIRALRNTRAEIVVAVNVADVLEAVRRLKEQNHEIRLLYPVHGIGSDYLLDLREFRGVIDAAVTMSRLAEAALLEAASIPRSRVFYVHYGVPEPLSPPMFTVGRPLELIYIGRLEQEQKRIHDLIALCDLMERRRIDVRLTIAGSGSQERSLRERLGSLSWVRFAGNLSREDLYRSIYPLADVLLLFSDWETGPIVAWEAMRHGVVPVTSAYAGLAAEKRIHHRVNGLVAPVGDIERFADHIEELSRDPEFAARLGRAAFATARTELSLEASLSEWGLAIDACSKLPPARDTRPVALPQSVGRLDRIAGRFAEPLRQLLGLGMSHRDSGGEWPHTYHHSDPRRPEVDKAIARLDR